MSKVNPDKMHDSIMNNIEWLVELDYLEYCGTDEYTNMSEAVYKFCLAYSERDFTERE